MAEGVKPTQLSKRIVRLLRSGGIPFPSGIEDKLYLRRVRRGRATEPVAWQLAPLDDAIVVPFEVWSLHPATDIVAAKKVIITKVSPAEYEIHLAESRKEKD